MVKRSATDIPALGRRSFLALSAASSALLLAGCVTATPPVTYDLTAAAAGPVGNRLSRTILIAVPQAIQTYDTDRIVAREPGGILSYLPAAQWSDNLPRLVQTRMLEAFQRAGVSNVGRTTDPLNADRVLASDIRAFELDVAAGRMAVVSLNVRLVDDRNRRIVSSSAFSASLPVMGSSPTDAIPVLNAALNDVVSQIIAWTVRHG
jgi:cholesterol transport system auxiliary component